MHGLGHNRDFPDTQEYLWTSQSALHGLPSQVFEVLFCYFFHILSFTQTAVTNIFGNDFLVTLPSLLQNSDLKKVGETSRPFRYHLNQIPYNYTEEVTNRLKGLDLIDRVPEELWMEVRNVVQEAMIKTITKKKKCKKAKWLSEEALQIAEKRREAKAKEKRKDISIWMQSSKE